MPETPEMLAAIAACDAAQDRLRDVRDSIDCQGCRKHSLYFAELKREERRAKYAVKKTEAVYDRLVAEAGA